MKYLTFICPPLPHYVGGGQDTYNIGRRHIERRNIQVFDLIVVTEGTLYLGEDDERFEVSGGEALILRPNGHHFATESCRKKTHFYWMHFQTRGRWSEDEVSKSRNGRSANTGTSDGGNVTDDRLAEIEGTGNTDIGYPKPHSVSNISVIDISYPDIRLFDIQVPKLCGISAPETIYSHCVNLIELEPFPQSTARLTQQHEFQEILKHLTIVCDDSHSTQSVRNIAEKAAYFLRMNFSEHIEYKDLANALKFHPTYIARCMQKVYGFTPSIYLMHYRVEQAKSMLIFSDQSIEKISELTGFTSPGYFTRCFAKIVGVSPRAYRKNFD